MNARRILSFLLAAALFLPVLLAAQQHEPPAQPQEQHAEQPPAHGANQATTEGELAHASKEAAGVDEHAVFKYSPSVQWLADLTGISLHAAYWVSVVLNFLVIAVLIGLVMRAKMPGAFAARTAAIRKQIDESRRASEEAGRRLSDIEGRLARLDSEIAGLRSQAEADATREEERLRLQAEEERQKIVQGAEQEIAAAARLARTELKAYAAELAVSLAEKKIQVSPDADRELVRSFVDKLTEDGK